MPGFEGQQLGNFRSALRTKQRIYQALVIRFVIGRYGRENIGFLWTVVEPMILCTGVMSIWALTKGSSYHGVNVVAFVLTGYMPLTLWRHQTSSMVNITKHTKFLTIFRNLTILDSILSKLALEFISVTVAGVVVFSLLYIFGMIEPPHDIEMILTGWMAMGAVSASFGILIAALSETSEIIEKLNQPVQYFLIPFCGCFFMVDWLPDSAKEYILFVPLVHPYEIIRGGFFGPEIVTHGSPAYALGCALVTAGLGFFLYERVKDHVHA